MILPQKLIDKGFSIAEVTPDDFGSFKRLRRCLYEKYVDQYFGGWVEEKQNRFHKNEFEQIRTCFKKVVMNGETVGFFAYDEAEDKIDEISIFMLEKAQNQGIGSFYLEHIISLSDKGNKPIFLQVFKSNPAQNLYKRFGFVVYDETKSHSLMKYDPKT